MPPIQRKKVTKRQEQHPVQALTATDPAKPPAVAAGAFPAASQEAQSAEPKVPTSFRLPRRLLDRLDAGAVKIPAALGRRVSKNQLVETAIDEYLSSYDV